jgi:signal transduction histidine kinase/DNA-binding response OmpR family regulator
MKPLVDFLQVAEAVAFVALGLATAIHWIRRRDGSMAFLALAIILLAAVVGLGQLQMYLPFSIPLASQVTFLAFAGSAYALLRYRDALIPLPRRWHVAAITSLAASSALVIALPVLSIPRAGLVAIAIVWFAIWVACVVEPIVRFWLVARSLPAVQAWRLRSLSLGFGGLVALLIVGISLEIVIRQAAVQVLIDLMAIAIVPFLYASFAPPAWLRRQWRAQEEEDLRIFMENLLVANERDSLSQRALEVGMRLVGGASGVLFDASGRPLIALGISDEHVAELGTQLQSMQRGVNHVTLAGADTSVLTVPVAGLSGSGTFVVLSGPFTPEFGGDELSRVQQLMSAFVTALDRRHLIVQLKAANAALQDANKHKSVFLANMSHELRTPLNAIIGFSELLSDAKEGQFDAPTRTRFLNQIQTSGKHLLGLINDILDLSKVEAGQMELRLQAVDVRESVEQVVRTVEPLVAKKDIKLEWEADAGGQFLADGGKLKQMLLNLLSNAIKFTPEGGTVSIKVKRTGDNVEFAVRDTGIGIAPDDQKQIFKEFHQIDHGPGRKHEGTGLGLALTRRFALLHGGDVRVSSEVDKGSVFTLVLPLRQPAVAAPLPIPVPATNGHGPASGPLVLVVEDDPAAAELLTRQLIAAGYRTDVARTGKEALEKARRLQPAAITLDIILPEVDGWEVITRLKSDDQTSGIPIVVVSVVDNPELGMSLGAIDYFVKPVDGRLLVNRLNEFRAGRADGKDGIRVLVVDDEAANRTWLAKTLEPAGFTVVPASGGREAIRLAKTTRPDFVLLDLMMPDVTGYDVVEALRADDATRDVPIMVLTASHLSEADKKLLNGRVSQILSRGSVANSDIVGLLKRVVAHRNGGP